MVHAVVVRIHNMFVRVQCYGRKLAYIMLIVVMKDVY